MGAGKHELELSNCNCKTLSGGGTAAEDGYHHWWCGERARYQPYHMQLRRYWSRLVRIQPSQLCGGNLPNDHVELNWQTPTMMATHTVVLKKTVAWNTEWRFWVDIPCERRMRKAYSDPADEEITFATCSSIEKLWVSVIPSNFKLETRGISGIKGTSHTERLRGLTKTISFDFCRFSWRLFATDHVCTLSSSWPLLSTLQPGIMRSKSSANFTNLFRYCWPLAISWV